MLSTGASRPLLISRMNPNCFFQLKGSQCSVFTGETASTLSYSTFSCPLLRLRDGGRASVSVFGCTQACWWRSRQPPERAQRRENEKYCSIYIKTKNRGVNKAWGGLKKHLSHNNSVTIALKLKQHCDAGITFGSSSSSQRSSCTPSTLASFIYSEVFASTV